MRRASRHALDGRRQRTTENAERARYWRRRGRRQSARVDGLRGGKLVYQSGVGVVPAHGVYRSDAPAVADGDAGAFFKVVATDLVHGLQHMAENVNAGKMVPGLTVFFRKDGASAAPTRPTPSM